MCIRELVRHLSSVHLWAAAHVANRWTEWRDHGPTELMEYWPDLAVFWPNDDELIDWYLDTNANLVKELTNAPADLDCLTFLPAPTPLAHMARGVGAGKNVRQSRSAGALVSSLTRLAFVSRYQSINSSSLGQKTARSGQYSMSSVGPWSLHSVHRFATWAAAHKWTLLRCRTNSRMSQPVSYTHLRA